MTAVIPRKRNANAAGLDAGSRISCLYRTALLALIPLISAYLIAMAFGGNGALTDVANRAGPIWFFAILAVCAYRVVRRDVRMVWTPLFWLPAQSAIFFGLGPLVAVFGNDATRERLDSSYLSFTDWELLWANQLSTVGVWCLLLGVFLHMVVAKKAWRSAIEHRPVFAPALSSTQVALVFVVFGAILKYGFAMPAAWGMLDIIVPGFLTSVLSLLDIGFAIMAFRAARGDSRMRALLLVLLPVHVVLSALTFSKQQLIISLLLPALGDLLGRANLRRFAAFVMGISIIYGLSQDFVHYGRNQIIAETGTIWNAGYLERIDIAASYFVGTENVDDQSVSEGGDFQGWWTRLNYAGVQVAARDLYIAGVDNNSLQGLGLYFVPRVLWPGKPVIVGPGWFFYERLTGREGSFLGLSIYGDLFWLGGWLATVLGALLIGWLFAVASIRSARSIRDRDFLMFPLILLVLKASIFGPTNFVANGIIAVIPMYIAYMLLMYCVSIFVKQLSLGRIHHHCKRQSATSRRPSAEIAPHE